MKNAGWIYVGWAVFVLVVVLPVVAAIESDLNNDNRVDMQDFNIMAKEWGQREPDYLLKIFEYEGKRGLTLREKQMLHVARVKYYAFLTGVLKK